MEALTTVSACYTFPPHSVISVNLLTSTLDLCGKSYTVDYRAAEITVTVMTEAMTTEEGEK